MFKEYVQKLATFRRSVENAHTVYENITQLLPMLLVLIISYWSGLTVALMLMLWF